MKLQEILRSKNDVLKRLVEMTESCLNKALESQFEDLDQFQGRRANLFKALAAFDKKVTNSVETFSRSDLTEGTRLRLLGEHNEGRKLLEQLTDLDRRLIEVLKAEFSRVGEEIQANRRSQTKLGKFKSEWVPNSGSELDQEL